MKASRIAIVVLVLAVIAAFFVLDLADYFSLAYLQEQRSQIVDFYQSNPVLTIVIFVATYVLLTGFSIPSAAALALLAGAIFDLVVGVLLVSLASTLGATTAFLIARYALRDALHSKFQEQFERINNRVEKDGIFYLFALRLVPAIPYFTVNLALALTSIRLWSFVWVSMVGMLAGTVVYVNAGSQLAEIHDLADVFSPALVASFALIGLVPLVAKWILDRFRRTSTKD